MQVVIDGEAFFEHARSDITRYFTQLVGAFASAPAWAWRR